MKISKRSGIHIPKEIKTTENWDRLNEMLKPCKYCGKKPDMKFDMDEEKYYYECCKDYNKALFIYLEDAIKHHLSFKKPGIVAKIKGVISQ